MENINWAELPFGYFSTDYNVRTYYKNGKWSELEACTDETITMHMAATCLHYGQQGFEGLKAYRGKDGKIRMFRLDENAKRMVYTANGIKMQPVPEKLFMDACVKAVKLNEKFVPPYGTGASLYLRPLLIGTGPQVGVRPAEEYTFIVFACPVGPYFKTGFKPVKMQIVRDFDRAAPLGTGTYKVGGNYAASLQASVRAQSEGFATVLFLDAKEKKYIDEAGPANFFAIKGNEYITPKSASILRSITNMSLRELATDMGLTVVERSVSVDELESFEEVGACGTAAVITPIGEITDRELKHTYKFGQEGVVGKVSVQLYERLVGIQLGDVEDKFGWVTFVES
ncbi:MAG: branched-chain amino acid aminotransferase [Bacteroidales bacterium]|jgi:branched-chain amino acid aminotransferase|nr:branched-chain amino acid aminotransferase [Bacteroidales bacterium]